VSIPCLTLEGRVANNLEMVRFKHPLTTHFPTAFSYKNGYVSIGPTVYFKQCFVFDLSLLSFVSWQLIFWPAITCSFYIYGTTLPSKHQQICFFMKLRTHYYQSNRNKTGNIVCVVSPASANPLLIQTLQVSSLTFFFSGLLRLTWYHFSRQAIPRCEELALQTK